MRRHRVREYFQRRKLAKMSGYGMDPAVIGESYPSQVSYQDPSMMQPQQQQQQQMVMTPQGGFMMKVRRNVVLTTLTTWTLLHGVVALYHVVKTGRYLIRRRNLKLTMAGLAASGIDPALVNHDHLIF
jgi:hypothetical protein